VDMDLSPLLPTGFLFCHQQFTDEAIIIGLLATEAFGT